MQARRRDREIDLCSTCTTASKDKDVIFIKLFEIKLNKYIEIPMCERCRDRCIGDHLCPGNCCCISSFYLDSDNEHNVPSVVYVVNPLSRHDENTVGKCTLERFIEIYES